MEWTEPQEMAIARAKLRNSIGNRAFNIALSVVGWCLLGLVILVALFIKHGKILWDVTFITVAFFMIIGVLLHLFHHWHRPRIGNISLDTQSFTVKYKRTLRKKGVNNT